MFWSGKAGAREIFGSTTLYWHIHDIHSHSNEKQNSIIHPPSNPATSYPRTVHHKVPHTSPPKTFIQPRLTPSITQTLTHFPPTLLLPRPRPPFPLLTGPGALATNTTRGAATSDTPAGSAVGVSGTNGKTTSAAEPKSPKGPFFPPAFAIVVVVVVGGREVEEEAGGAAATAATAAAAATATAGSDELFLAGAAAEDDEEELVKEAAGASTIIH